MLTGSVKVARFVTIAIPIKRGLKALKLSTVHSDHVQLQLLSRLKGD